jgi:hypothetical protein
MKEAATVLREKRARLVCSPAPGTLAGPPVNRQPGSYHGSDRDTIVRAGCVRTIADALDIKSFVAHEEKFSSDAGARCSRCVRLHRTTSLLDDGRLISAESHSTMNGMGFQSGRRRASC